MATRAQMAVTHRQHIIDNLKETLRYFVNHHERPVRGGTQGVKDGDSALRAEIFMSDRQWYGCWTMNFAANAAFCLWACIYFAQVQNVVMWAWWLVLFAVATDFMVVAGSRALRS